MRRPFQNVPWNRSQRCVVDGSSSEICLACQAGNISGIIRGVQSFLLLQFGTSAKCMHKLSTYDIAIRYILYACTHVTRHHLIMRYFTCFTLKVKACLHCSLQVIIIIRFLRLLRFLLMLLFNSTLLLHVF